ncbi:MAG: PLD nuclease N-terminal domain-containing protein [Brachybacterium sp.]|nr:PLD nuclease N-terminal domain-containing protein [Brachybacterium sp.]
MLRGVLAVLSIALTIFALADCIQTDRGRVRGIPKWAWIVVILLAPWVGPITWLLIGKEGGLLDPEGAERREPRSPGPRGHAPRGRGGRRPRPLAPDEDPDFLRRLDEDIRRERREKKRREEETRGPEDDTPPPASGS